MAFSLGEANPRNWSRESAVSSRPVAPPVPRRMDRDDQVGQREDRREIARSGTGSWQVAGSLYSRVTCPLCANRTLARLHRVSYRTAEIRNPGQTRLTTKGLKTCSIGSTTCPLCG